jgi:hypothetical protein
MKDQDAHRRHCRSHDVDNPIANAGSHSDLHESIRRVCRVARDGIGKRSNQSHFTISKKTGNSAAIYRCLGELFTKSPYCAEKAPATAKLTIKSQ